VGSAPTIALISNPYRLTDTYEQISSIQFRVDQNSDVQVMILKPGEVDHTNSANIVGYALIDGNALASVPANTNKEARWVGFDPTDSNVLLADEEGPFTFVVRAVSQTTLQESIYRGVLSIYH